MGSKQVQSAKSVPLGTKTPQKRGLQSAGSSSTSLSASKKRKAEVVDIPSGSAKKAKNDKPKEPKEPKEKRRRKFRDHPPQAFHDVYARALSQRFYVLSRESCGSDECPGEVVEMTGSTGNIYTVVIAEQSTCDCPHAVKGNQCKHVIYVMKRVLKAPFEHVYQLALLPSELRTIFAAAPPINSPGDADGEANKRKPLEGDCPICYCEFGTQEAVVWCKAACGQNIHKQCFQMWAQTKTGGKVTCPFCRSAWQGDVDVSKVKKEEGVLDEGYVNVADQLGINRARDESTYSTWYRGSGWNSSYSGWGRSGHRRRWR